MCKETRIELPSSQSKELCHLIESIEKSQDGKRQLDSIFAEGNKVENSDGGKAGDVLKGVWNKDRENFYKDQLNNGKNCLGL